MDKQSIIERLEGCGYINDSAATQIDQFTTIGRSSLTTQQVDNRNSKGWVRGEYIVAHYENDNKTLSELLEGWCRIAERYKNQYLILEVGEGDWQMYDYNCQKLGGNEYIMQRFSSKSNNTESPQKIYYGCPGSGKSYKVKKDTEDVNTNFVFRTTFHPDTDYASFVGCYKPRSNNKSLLNGNNLTEEELLQRFFDSKDETKYKGEIKARYFYEYLINTSDIRKLGLSSSVIADKLRNLNFDKTAYHEASLMNRLYDWLHEDGYVAESAIAYTFCPQVFTNAYVQAWKNPKEKVYLIIEEINRGNCAQIFGDLFQLLDRDKNTGVSEYPVKADKDLADHLKEVLGADHEGIKDGELRLPSNLIIYATMNTSDQSLFPMDSAFKRRWDWEYVPIEYGADKESYIYIITMGEKKYRWIDFLKIVNEKIYDTTRSEDKQMGNFFIKKSVDAQEFINKVMFYLWNEVCKEEVGTSRNFFRIAVEGSNEGKEFKFVDLFDKANTNDLLIGFMNHLKVGEYTE